MATIQLTGYITEKGELKLNLPAGLPEGQVRVTIEVTSFPWTETEAADLIRPEPKSGAEIATSDAIGGWAHMGITDSAEFVADLRHKEEEHRRWQQDW